LIEHDIEIKENFGKIDREAVFPIITKTRQSMSDTTGRASQTNPANRFETLHIEPDEYLTGEDGERRKISTQFLIDNSKSVLARNDSPDIPFRYSINPYRGCEHGCIYCYARPSHEYLGFSSGLDFETRIMVKNNAADLLRDQFSSSSWQPQVVCLSGNTDCYQPVERKLKITRRLLEVFRDFRNPVSVITKNYLITRDIDILSELAERRLTVVMLSITTLDAELSGKMEPRTSAPHRRLEAIELLSKNNIPVGVNIAPIIPGLNDNEIPSILKSAKEAGAIFAGYIMLRLPYQVKDLFLDWIKREYPLKANKVISRIKQVRDGEMSSSVFGERLRGTGNIAKNIEQMFMLSSRKLSLNTSKPHIDSTQFRRYDTSQTDLFG
jgi:DNA repair photolyase